MRPASLRLRSPPAWTVALLVLLAPGCIKNIAANALADTLSGTGGSFATDDDPKLVEDALPFALKTMESVLLAVPEHRGLLAAAAGGFAEYAYGFLREDADQLELKDRAAAERLRVRVRKLLRRARAYGMRGLALRAPGFAEKLGREPHVALAPMVKEDVALLYWTAAAWAAEISLDKENMELVGELGRVEALARRALELDETWDEGSIHDLLMSYELARPDGGAQAVAIAKEHFDRAVALSNGSRLSVFVSWAEDASVKKQDRREFDALLARVLAFDVDKVPEHRLANLIAQERARRLKAKADDLFL